MELAIVLVIVSAMAFYLINKYLNQRAVELDKKSQLNTTAAEAALSAATTEKFNNFDDRLNKTWGAISSTKEELNAIRLQLAMGNKNGR